jgi:hypothetical protein
VLPFGPLLWFGGIIVLAVIGLRWVRSWRLSDAHPRTQPAVAGEAH